jgi:hypothetical protein
MSCHGWGACAGVSSSNALLFPVNLEWNDWVLYTALRNALKTFYLGIRASDRVAGLGRRKA